MTVAFSSFPTANLLPLSSCELQGKEGSKGDQSPSHLHPASGDNLLSQAGMCPYGKRWALHLDDLVFLTLLIQLVYPLDAGTFRGVYLSGKPNFQLSHFLA